MSHLEINAEIVAKVQQNAMEFDKVQCNMEKVKKMQNALTSTNIGIFYYSFSILIGPFCIW